jgi:hypothetical protein
VARDENARFNYALVAEGGEAKFLWRDHQVAMEFAWDEGFEFEQKIAMADLPPEKQSQARALGQGAERILLEEGFGIHKHFYEVYVLKNGKVMQHEI